jgi:DNA polymerase I
MVCPCELSDDDLCCEGALDEIDETVAATRAAMAETSRIVLDGLEVDTDVEIIAWPHRYADERGWVMWEQVTEILNRREGQEGSEG